MKGGPYSQGVYKMKTGEGGFGLMSVDDRGSRIDVTYSGRNNRNEEDHHEVHRSCDRSAVEQVRSV